MKALGMGSWAPLVFPSDNSSYNKVVKLEGQQTKERDRCPRRVSLWQILPSDSAIESRTDFEPQIFETDRPAFYISIYFSLFQPGLLPMFQIIASFISAVVRPISCTVRGTLCDRTSIGSLQNKRGRNGFAT